VRIAEHSDILDLGMLSQGVFNLCRENVLAAPDDEVFCPVGKEDEAFLVFICKVTGIKPAVFNRFGLSSPG